MDLKDERGMPMLIRGATVWNCPGTMYDQKQMEVDFKSLTQAGIYANAALETACELNRLGFTGASWHGFVFDKLNDREGEELARFLRNTGTYLTVHHILPNPADEAQCIAFRPALERMLQWHKQYGLLKGLTFDTWYERKSLLPYLELALRIFRGQGIFLCCEDFPLNATEFEIVRPILTPDDDFGILMDVGHMNLRQTHAGLVADEDFIRAFEALPVPVREVHLHDNRGETDDHMYMGYGTLPLKSVVKGLKSIGFNGVVSVEIIWRQWKREEGFAFTKQTSDAFFNLWEKA